MTNTKIDPTLENYWRGYLFLWGSPVPEAEGALFRRHHKVFYNIPLLMGETVKDVGNIYNVQKDDIGMFVLVRHGGTKTEEEAAKLEWAYTLKEPPTVIYQIDPTTGQPEKVMTHYLIQNISVREAQKDSSYASPTVVVESDQRKKRRGARPSAAQD